MTKNRKGFTLIEILVVVAIIAILSSVVLLGLGGTRKAGRDARRISDLRQLQSGLELFFNQCGIYPGGAFTGTNPNCGASDPYNPLFAQAIGASNVPKDPNGPNYGYCQGLPPGATIGSAYVVSAQLEDQNNPALNSNPSGVTVCNPTPACNPNPPGVGPPGVYCVSL